MDMAFDPSLLNARGLNRQVVLDTHALPGDVAAALAPLLAGWPASAQLILIGHGGRRLWDAVQAAGSASADPIDDFSRQAVMDWFATHYPQRRYRIVYPGPHAIGLQRLGELAGWHHAAPFMVGIDPHWGSWFAYRALLIADTRFAPTPPLRHASPCASCTSRVCVTSCPAAALADGNFDLGKCVAHRKQPASTCRDTCLARLACPVGAEHRYSDAQMRHSYGRSMQVIERLAEASNSSCGRLM